MTDSQNGFQVLKFSTRKELEDSFDEFQRKTKTGTKVEFYKNVVDIMEEYPSLKVRLNGVWQQKMEYPPPLMAFHLSLLDTRYTIVTREQMWSLTLKKKGNKFWMTKKREKMKPPTRKRSAKAPRELQIEEYSIWTLTERRRLLKALEKYPANQSAKIAKVVSTKSQAEVIHYISKLKRSLNREALSQCTPLHRKFMKNLGTWIRFTHQLVDDDAVEYSSMHGKLLALFGEYNFNRRSTTASFKAIYDYLSGLLLGIQLPTLPPLESAIVLDLLKNVATFLAQSDISFHKKFILRNYEEIMYADKIRKARGKDTILRKLLKEGMATPDNTASPSYSQDKKFPSAKKKHLTPEVSSNSKEDMVHRLKQIQARREPTILKTPPIYRKYYTQKTLSDGRKINVVHLARVDSRTAQTVSKPQSEESETSECSSREMESPGSSMGRTPKNSSALREKKTTNPANASAFAEIIITNTINDNNKEIDRQNKSSEIPSNSKTVKSSSDSIGKNSATYPLGGSAMQKDQTETPGQMETPGQQDPRDPPAQHALINPPVLQIKQEFITDQNSVADSQESNVPQVFTEVGSLPLPSRDYTSVTHVQNKDTDQQKSIGGPIGQVPGKANVLEVPTKGTLLHLPNGGTLLHLPTGGTLLHLPNGGTIKKEQDGTGLFQLPSGSTVQQGTDTLSIFQGPNRPFVPRDSTRDTVAKGTILSNPLPNPNEGTVQQSTGITNKRTILSRLLHEGADQQEASSSKVSQMTSKGPIPERSSDPLQMNSKDKAQQMKSSANVSEVTKSITTTTTTTHDISSVNITTGSPVIKIVHPVSYVSTETQTSRSDEDNHKRKLSNSNFGMASKRPKRSCQPVNYPIVDSESAESESETQKQNYKPNVSWLNPMNIPTSLINLTKTRQKRIMR